MENKAWDQRFLNLAFEISKWSKDTSTKVGCVIVGPDREIRSTGYNGFPRLVNDDLGSPRYERPAKYQFTEHAERNAIYNAARMGAALLNCTLYYASTQHAFPPCCDCARAIIQSGIKCIVGRTGDDQPELWRADWKDSMLVATSMLREAGVTFSTTDL